MKLGIDFGTTHTVVSVSDQGNYPIVSFSTPEGDWIDDYPSLIAVRGDDCLFGFNAQKVIDDPSWITIRSIKSLLKHIHQVKTIQLQEKEFNISSLLTQFLSHLKVDIEERSNLDFEQKSPLQVTIAVPAQTNNTQRFITTECFSSAGFEVVNMITEPSAATLEYTQSFYKKRSNITKKYLLVYDLGGGTFDASIAEVKDQFHKIIATEGIDSLGGDQFDEVLANMVKAQRKDLKELNYRDEIHLLELCKKKKELLTPYSKVILLEFGPEGEESYIYKIKVSDYYEQCEPLINKTIEVLDRLIQKVFQADPYEEEMAFYLVGGMSNFPKINRSLKDKFGSSRVRKSKHCNASTAIGLAVLTDMDNEYILKESLTQHFGLWREAENGQALVFDPIFAKDQTLPAKGEDPIILQREYSPSHNIGVFRFQECSRLDQSQPSGLVTVWNTIKFPFDPKLQNKDLSSIMIKRYQTPSDDLIRELYMLNDKGEISVELIHLKKGYSKTFPLFRMTTSS